jgi:hypothetical protein
MRFSLSRNACLVTFWPALALLRIHEPSELRLGERQQRADRFGFDIEDSCHGVRFDPFVA